MNTTKPETVTFTKVVPIADADGVAIFEGSVLRQIEDGERGVVTRIIRLGDWGTVLDSIGDVQILMRPGCHCITQQYSKWKHIPHNEQTFNERLTSWFNKKFHHDPDYSRVTLDEARAISAIMNLMPDDIISEYGPFADRLEDALTYLADYMTKLQKTKNEHDEA